MNKVVIVDAERTPKGAFGGALASLPASQMGALDLNWPTMYAYCSSKAAVNKVMQGLATSLEPEAIPVVLVDPGWVRTDMGGLDAEEDPTEVAQGMLAIAERLTIKDTGKFFRFTGEEREF